MMGVPLTKRDTEITRRLAEPPLDPMEAWRAFKPNSLIWARWWLENGGELPASCHHVIVDRLAPFIAAVKAGGLALRDELLAVVPPIPTPEPAPTRNWIMPAVGKTYSMERESDEAEQVDMRSGAEPVQAPEKPLSAGPGGVTQEPGDVRHPSTGVTHQEGGVVPFPLPEGTRACGSCGKAFKLYRPSASFCSSACRQRAYRKRQAA